MNSEILFVDGGAALAAAPAQSLSETGWMFGTFVLRFGEALIAAFPDLLIGALIAVLLRHALGDLRLRRWFGKVWVAPIAALALPVGAAGVLPIAVMLRRAGVRVSAIAAVLLVGGAAGPLSLAYLMERTTPAFAALLGLMLAATAVLVFLAGGKRLTETVGTDAPGLTSALGEVRPVIAASVLPLVIGVVCFAAVASTLPPSFLGEAMHDPSPAHMVGGIIVPVVGSYLPDTAALFSGEAAAGHYVGAAWSMLLGGGITLGSVLLALRLVGLRTGIVSTLVVGAVLLIGFTALQFAPRAMPMAPEDSHAFDSMSQPFHVLDHPDGTVAGIFGAWANATSLGTWIAIALAAVLLVVPWGRVGGKAESKHLSPGRLRTFGAIGVAAWAALTVWIYYPTPGTTLEQMRNYEGELSAALGQGEPDQALVALSRIDRLAHRGRVGALLRIDGDTADQLAGVRTSAADLTDELDRTPQAITIADATELFKAIRAVR